jgi:predicted NBD/HSP70 family sugar kinase
MPKIADQWLQDVLSAVYQRPAVTREEITKATGLNPASVSHALQFLLRTGTIQKMGALQSRGGRRREVLKLNAESGYFVAVDLETTRLRVALTNLIGDVRHRQEEDLEFGQELDLRSLAQALDRVQRNLAPWQLSRVLALGLCYPGVMDDAGKVTAVNLGWHKFPLAEKLRQVTPLPIFLETSCRTYALAERWIGLAQNTPNCVFVELGKGVGAGILADDRYLAGSRHMAGELGHLTVDPASSDRCNCGKQGCLEAIVSSPNIVRQYFELVDGAEAPSGISVNAIFEKARNHDPAALQVMDRVSRALGLGLSHLILLLNPRLIVLGGDVAQGDDLLLPRIRKEIARHVPEFVPETELCVTRLGQDIGLKGAALLAFRNSVKDPVLLKKLCKPITETLEGGRRTRRKRSVIQV